MKERRHGLLRFPLPTLIGHTPDGQEIELITSQRDVRTIGEAVRPLAHELAKALLLNVHNPRRKPDEQVSIPSSLANAVACLLLTLPGSRRGRPPKASTLHAERLVADLGSKLAAARAVSDKTGEPVGNLRRRLRPKKPDKPKGGT